ncbi:MAG: integration host factor subunit beta [Bacteroidetes bacterium]|nr:integration host factor subunit beta [Bacteroidota bacterium]
MTKADIVNEIAEKTGIEKVDVQGVVETFFDVMKDTMSQGHNVYFRGFGSFVVKTRARKVARNIAKNTSMIIEPHNVPDFKPSKTFIDQVKNGVQVK